MFSRLDRLAIWKYSLEVPETTLRRHYRVARSVVRAWTAIAVLVMSSFAEGVLLRGSSTFALAVLATSSVVGVFLLLPGNLGIFWANEIERELARRGLADCQAQSVDGLAAATAMKVALWTAATVIGFHCLSAAAPG